MLDVIDRAGMRRNVLVASEHQEPLDEVRKLAPEIPTNFSYLESGQFIQAMVGATRSYRPPGDAVQIPHRHGIVGARHAGERRHSRIASESRCTSGR